MSGRRAPDDELQRALDELRAEFAAGLPAKIDDLARSATAARDRPEDKAAWDEAHTKAHKLHGSSGSYGFARTGLAARRIEHSLEATRTEDPRRREEAWLSVDAGIAELLSSPSPRSFPAPPSLHPSIPSPPPALRALNAPCVLVVDDDPDFLRHVEVLARQQLFVLRTARTPEEAIATAHADRIDAALVDAHLDAASSFDLARRLRSISPAMSLAFISADEGVATRVAAAHAGATLFLSKPLGAFELTTAMRSLLVDRNATRPRVLLVDDDAEYVALAAAILEMNEIETTTETDPSRVLDALDRVRPDLMLTDIHMPSVNGVDVCRTVRVTQRWQSLPIIVLTRDASLETRMNAYEAGADDYLVKPVIPQELLSRVRVRVDRARLLHEMTHVDPLTRLLSRRAFLEALAPRVSDAIRHDKPLAIALLDVDHFKRVNDQHGHAAGDRVLAAVGELLSSRFRLEDLRCRWGGEEFVVAFPGEPTSTITAVLERVLVETRALAFAGSDNSIFHVTFSAGVASLPADGELTEALMKIADERLYTAKRTGRARIVGT